MARYIRKPEVRIKGFSAVGLLLLRAALALALAIPSVPAAQQAGDFDYYLLALSWSPSWCETTGDARDAEECEPGAGHGFVLHGLWPQFETGWPEWCETSARDPVRSEITAMEDIMASEGLARHQWRKHGSCSGLEPEEYYALARRALESIELPQPPADGQTTAAELKEAVLALNRKIAPDELVVTCGDGLVREIRVCLGRDLDPRPCGRDVQVRACSRESFLQMPRPR